MLQRLSRPNVRLAVSDFRHSFCIVRWLLWHNTTSIISKRPRYRLIKQISVKGLARMRARDEFRARTHHRGGILIANLAREHTFLAFSLPLNISLMLFGQSAHGTYYNLPLFVQCSRKCDAQHWKKTEVYNNINLTLRNSFFNFFNLNKIFLHFLIFTTLSSLFLIMLFTNFVFF